ncbi:EFR1 family ferrodoxin [Clostridium sp. DJ247]|uniref:EFR1 family ferrodoxin n=1 Tax=Clostridium sp. DJ247 TaxID=2726188 RepID=UPI001628328D|nr:EFR1 family ferrodoxin [Clostridium sp. DJ247]MBC2582847.1 4Fe-4S binding protein [Clostridium sp. DJ247]
MKGVLYYFSGTGNTRWVANKFKEYFNTYNVDLALYSIELLEEVNINLYDFIIIGSPVYADIEPKIVDDFLNKLPSTKKGIKSIIYTTQGTKSSAAVYIIENKIKKRGYNIVAKANMQMPSNCYFIVGKKPTLDNENDILAFSDKKVQNIVKNFMEHNDVNSKVLFMRVRLAKTYNKLYKRFLPKISKNITSTKDCTKCGLCLINCPKNNITFENGHAIFHSKCMLCLRCIYVCPKNVIRYKGKKIDQIQKERVRLLDLNK